MFSAEGAYSLATETIPAAATPASAQAQPVQPQSVWEAPTLATAGTGDVQAASSSLAWPELPSASSPTQPVDDEPALAQAMPDLAVVDSQEKPPHRWLPTSATIATLLLKWGPWALGIIGLGFLIAFSATTPSWGTIAWRAGFTLLGIGIGAAALHVLYRALQQRWVRRRWPIITACLLALGGLGIALAPTLHLLQGQTLEHRGQYQRAIEEYTASGEQTPDGQNSARCYLEWGQQDLQQQDYAAAVQHLGAAAERYPATPSARQAREPMGKALLLYGQELAHKGRYAQALQQFDHLLKRYSDTAAAQQAIDEQDEPATYLAWGQMLQAEQHFPEALRQFQTIQQQFPQSFYAPLAYRAAASDLYAWGKALIQQAKYNEAIKLYQQLIDQYSQAPEANQAQQDLSAPQQVTGRLIFPDGTPDAHVVVRLSSSWRTGPGGYVQGGYVYETHTDKNGNFTFSRVNLGTYLIDWQQGSSFTTLLHPGTYDPVYIATVEPLRATDLGDIQIQQS